MATKPNPYTTTLLILVKCYFRWEENELNVIFCCNEKFCHRLYLNIPKPIKQERANDALKPIRLVRNLRKTEMINPAMYITRGTIATNTGSRFKVLCM